MENYDRDIERKTPPLSLLDKAYFTLSVFCLVGFMCAVLLWKTQLVLFIRFQNPSVIASTSGGAEIGTIPILAVLTLSGFLLYLRGWKNQIPIFGNREIQYGEPPWNDTYPLFWRNKPKKKHSSASATSKKAHISLSYWSLPFFYFCWSYWPIYPRQSGK